MTTFNFGKRKLFLYLENPVFCIAFSLTCFTFCFAVLENIEVPAFNFILEIIIIKYFRKR